MCGSTPALPAGGEIVTDPPSYGSMPAMMFNRVDLPQPDGPTMLTNSPSATVKLTASMTVNLSPPPGAENRFVRLPTVMTADADGACLADCARLIRAISIEPRLPGLGPSTSRRRFKLRIDVSKQKHGAPTSESPKHRSVPSRS